MRGLVGLVLAGVYAARVALGLAWTTTGRTVALVLLLLCSFSTSFAQDEYANDPYNPIIARDAWILIGQTEKAYGIPVGLLHAIALTESGKGIRGWVLPWPYTIGVNSTGLQRYGTASQALAGLSRMKNLGFVRFEVKAGGQSNSNATFAQAQQMIQANGAANTFSLNPKPFGRRFNNTDEAVAFALRQFSMGHRNLDVGMMQINWKVHGHHFGSVRQALEPQANVSYAVNYLLTHRQTRDWWESVGRYHSGTPRYARVYIKNVWNMYQRIHRLKA